MLAGNNYVEPLLESDVFEPFPWVTRFPFQEQDFDGIGEQMQWLSEEADRFEDLRSDPAGSVRQTQVRSYRRQEDPAVELPATTGQTEWSDWSPESE